MFNGWGALPRDRGGTSRGFFPRDVRYALPLFSGQMALFALLRRATPVARERAPCRRGESSRFSGSEEGKAGRFVYQRGSAPRT